MPEKTRDAEEVELSLSYKLTSWPRVKLMVLSAICNLRLMPPAPSPTAVTSLGRDQGEVMRTFQHDAGNGWIRLWKIHLIQHPDAPKKLCKEGMNASLPHCMSVGFFIFMFCSLQSHSKRTYLRITPLDSLLIIICL